MRVYSNLYTIFIHNISYDYIIYAHLTDNYEEKVQFAHFVHIS
jgi:hypothetical protein